MESIIPDEFWPEYVGECNVLEMGSNGDKNNGRGSRHNDDNEEDEEEEDNPDDNENNRMGSN